MPPFTEPLPVRAAPFSYFDNPGLADQERVEKQEDVKSKCSSVSTHNDAANNNDDGVVWFEVRAKDVVTIQLEDGRSVYFVRQC
jgi:acyl-coenzyme A synthetase/AMP-(fatty) acid ligase